MLRPISRISAAGVRTSMPLLETTTTESLVEIGSTATTTPFLSLVWMSMRPLPPRDWARVEPSSLCTRYSPNPVRLPKPFEVTVSRARVSSQRTMPTTASLSASSMPFTPAVSRPMTRASSSSKRMAMPSFVASNTWSVPDVEITPTRLSPSLSAMAMMPPRFTLR